MHGPPNHCVHLLTSWGTGEDLILQSLAHSKCLINVNFSSFPKSTYLYLAHIKHSLSVFWMERGIRGWNLLSLRLTVHKMRRIMYFL
jgi:hypothetical protein